MEVLMMGRLLLLLTVRGTAVALRRGRTSELMVSTRVIVLVMRRRVAVLVMLVVRCRRAAPVTERHRLFLARFLTLFAQGTKLNFYWSSIESFAPLIQTFNIHQKSVLC